jgi:hypothetical protein
VNVRTPVAIAALAGAVLSVSPDRVAAQMRHGGVPERVVADRRAGPYAISVWAKSDVGMGMLYIVYDTPARAAFVPPRSVRVAVAPASGRVPEQTYEAHPEDVEHGARYVAHVPFDRDETWNVRVLTAGPAGDGELRTAVRATASGLGPFGLVLYALPILVIVGMWGRTAIDRRRSPQPHPALAPR